MPKYMLYILFIVIAGLLCWWCRPKFNPKIKNKRKFEKYIVFSHGKYSGTCGCISSEMEHYDGNCSCFFKEYRAFFKEWNKIVQNNTNPNIKFIEHRRCIPRSVIKPSIREHDKITCYLNKEDRYEEYHNVYKHYTGDFTPMSLRAFIHECH